MSRWVGPSAGSGPNSRPLEPVGECRSPQVQQLEAADPLHSDVPPQGLAWAALPLFQSAVACTGGLDSVYESASSCIAREACGGEEAPDPAQRPEPIPYSERSGPGVGSRSVLIYRREPEMLPFVSSFSFS